MQFKLPQIRGNFCYPHKYKFYINFKKSSVINLAQGAACQRFLRGARMLRRGFALHTNANIKNA